MLSGIPVNQDDFLKVDALSSTTGVGVTVFLILERPDGVIDSITVEAISKVASVPATSFSSLRPGRVISVQAIAFDPASTGTSITCSVSLSRSAIAPKSVYYVFLSGLLSGTSTLVYPSFGPSAGPSSYLVFADVDTPEILSPTAYRFVVPSGVSWTFRQLSFDLNTSVTAGLRFVTLSFASGLSSGGVAFGSITGLLASSSTRCIFRALSVPEAVNTVLGEVRLHIPCSPVVCPPSTVIMVSVAGTLGSDTVIQRDACFEERYLS